MLFFVSVTDGAQSALWLGTKDVLFLGCLTCYKEETVCWETHGECWLCLSTVTHFLITKDVLALFSLLWNQGQTILSFLPVMPPWGLLIRGSLFRWNVFECVPVFVHNFQVFACLSSPSQLFFFFHAFIFLLIHFSTSCFHWRPFSYLCLMISRLHLPPSGLSVGGLFHSMQCCQAVLHDVVLCEGIQYSVSADLAALVWCSARQNRCNPKRKLQHWKRGQARGNVRQEWQIVVNTRVMNWPATLKAW